MTDLYVRTGSRDRKPNPDAFWSDKWGWLDEASPADLVGVVRHLPNVEEVEALWMEDAEFGEPIHYLPVEGPGRYLVVELDE